MKQCLFLILVVLQYLLSRIAKRPKQETKQLAEEQSSSEEHEAADETIAETSSDVLSPTTPVEGCSFYYAHRDLPAVGKKKNRRSKQKKARSRPKAVPGPRIVFAPSPPTAPLRLRALQHLTLWALGENLHSKADALIECDKVISLQSHHALM